MNINRIVGQLDHLLPIILGGGITCVVVVISMISMGFAFWKIAKMMKGMSANKALQSSGVPAPAQVSAIQDTGVTLNDNPQMVIQLMVHPPDGPSYTAQVVSVISRLQASAFQQGSLVHVRYDPFDRNKVAIVGPLGDVDTYAPPGGATPDLLPTLHRLLRAQLLHERLATKGMEVEGEVVSVQEIGLHAGGKNPFMALEIALSHPHEGRYTATTEGVVSQLSVGKYQPGQQVIVRVDPMDRQQITMVRSA